MPAVRDVRYREWNGNRARADVPRRLHDAFGECLAEPTADGPQPTGIGWCGRLRTPCGRRTVAVAHSILVICRHLLTNDWDYDDLGGDYFTRRNVDRQRDRLIAQLQGLGYRVTLSPVSPPRLDREVPNPRGAGCSGGVPWFRAVDATEGQGEARWRGV